MPVITTTTELASMNDISDAWKIAARSEVGIGWHYCGEIADETQTFHRLAFPVDGEQPHISVVTGRDRHGALVLYARIFPVALRENRAPPGKIRHLVSGQR